MPHPVMRQKPHHAAVVAAGREAADEVGLVVGDDARQYGDAEARADRRQQAGRGAVVDRDLVVETELWIHAE